MTKTKSNSPENKFDYTFIGMGASNCLLLLRLNENGLLDGKKIAIIEPDSKKTNDRTFCFWATHEELKELKVDNLVSHSWKKIEIGNISNESIAPLNYFHIKGIDLYIETRKQIAGHEVTLFPYFLKKDAVIKDSHYQILFENESIECSQVFDSRPPIFAEPKKNQSHLYQSFYGWNIDTTGIDSSRMVLMDFNVPQDNYTQFMYVLPFDKNTALVELTRFGEGILSREEAEISLKAYCDKAQIPYTIVSTEHGVIPMSCATIKKDQLGKNWVEMGTRSHLLKCTTGFAFHAMSEDACKIADTLLKNKSISRKIKTNRFAFYDRLLLNILKEKPENGKLIFETLFSRVSTKTVLNFLREKTHIGEDLFIFSKLPKAIFLKMALKDIAYYLKKLPVLVLPSILTAIAILFSLANLNSLIWIIVGIGFFSVGLSHGSLDHLTSHKIESTKQLGIFIATYLLKGGLFGLVWWFYPDLALISFILYSGWHFGQADFQEWKLGTGVQSAIWGILLLVTILIFHFDEFIVILGEIPNLKSLPALSDFSTNQIKIVQAITIVSAIILAVKNKSLNLFWTLFYLVLSSMLPLLISFGIYFVFQHSRHGWSHLKKGLKENGKSLWKKSMPFSIGGALIILGFFLFGNQNQVGTFFIVLSSLSLPHVISMQHFYSFNNEKKR